MKPAQIYAEAGVEVIIVKQSADGVIIAEAGGIKFPCRIEHLTESPASIKPVTKVEAVFVADAISADEAAQAVKDLPF